MRALYNILLFPLRLFLPVSAAIAGGNGDRALEWRERRARTVPTMPPGGIWIHGSSVGEARIASSLAAALQEKRLGLPIAVSAFTRTGRSVLPSPPKVAASFFLPLDFPGFPETVLDAVRPVALILVETELWPNLLSAAFRRGTQVLIVNGRLSPARMKRYSRLKGLYRPLFQNLERIGAQSEGDAARFRSLGISHERISLTGNIKYDIPSPPVSRRDLFERFGLLPGTPVLIAGSTDEGEEKPVLEAFRTVRSKIPEAWLILAPRHPERSGRVNRLAAQEGLTLHRLQGNRDRDAGDSDGLLVDTIGELAGLYPVGRAAFIGGSLVPVGGHNVLEPAAAGIPVLFGPYTDHFKEPVDSLLSAGGAVRVRNASELADAWARFLEAPDTAGRSGACAKNIVKKNQGAMQRSIRLILETLGTGAAEAGKAKSP